MEGILGNKDNVVKVLFFVNLAFFVFSIFISFKWFCITMAVVNVIMAGSFLILKKYGFMIQGIVMGNKMLTEINNGLNRISNNGQIPGKV